MREILYFFSRITTSNFLVRIEAKYFVKLILITQVNNISILSKYRWKVSTINRYMYVLNY